MANRYVLKFSKNGYAKYTSHLDMIRFFKRAFRKSGVHLKYSQGFNPHPKMGFAQPLSLGYGSCCELLEFETDEPYNSEELYKLLEHEMPDGLDLQWCKPFDIEAKSLAAVCESAEYEIVIPYVTTKDEMNRHVSDYLQQKEILAMKRQKKSKKMVYVDIKKMIRSFEYNVNDATVRLKLILDSGSISNCSPELVITSFCRFAGIMIPRYEIEVERKSLNFYNNLQI